MADADTPLKRYSAMNLASPWRGLNVIPDVAIPQGERQAAMFMYSGILASPFVPPTPGGGDTTFWFVSNVQRDGR